MLVTDRQGSSQAIDFSPTNDLVMCVISSALKKTFPRRYIVTAMGRMPTQSFFYLKLRFIA